MNTAALPTAMIALLLLLLPLPPVFLRKLPLPLPLPKNLALPPLSALPLPRAAATLYLTICDVLYPRVPLFILLIHRKIKVFSSLNHLVSIVNTCYRTRMHDQNSNFSEFPFSVIQTSRAAFGDSDITRL